MTDTAYVTQFGPFEARYLAFQTITQLWPPLHRCCARMMGSAIDSEDVVQEALFKAYIVAGRMLKGGASRSSSGDQMF